MNVARNWPQPISAPASAMCSSPPYGWDASPVSVARIAAELWPLIKNEDWSFVSPQGFIGNWPSRLWNIDKHYQYIGGQGAAGMGYGAPASVGAALANKKHGRLSINIQTDGDFNYAPGVLWTAAHHKIPLLTIMHNNRGYHQEVMFIEQQASLRNRGAETLPHRHQAVGSEHRLREDREGLRHVRRRPDHRSQGPRSPPSSAASSA